MSNEKSVLQKLKNKARIKKLPFQLILQLFCQEEFLRRLSNSKYKDNFILKGGLFLFLYNKFEGRPTMDIDFLARAVSNNREDMEKVIQEIINTPSENDYIQYQIKSIENITEQKDYHGLRIKVIGSVLNTRTPFDIDIGIGDIVVPEASYHMLSPQMNDFSAAEILTYSLESTIAEKWEAMISRMETTSRMKDYYDIYYLACHYDFEGNVLKDAIKTTLDQRGTAYNLNTLESIASIHEDNDMQKRWLSFTKNSLGLELEFKVVVEIVIAFIRKPMESIITNQSFEGVWYSNNMSYD